MNKTGKGAQWLFSGNGLIYPDFIGKNSKNRIIADAKYKPEDNIGNKDYLQVLAYMFRFDAKRGYYLYPEVSDVEDKTLWLNRGVSFERNVIPRDDIYLVKQGLKIPTNIYSYDEFASSMHKSEELFISTILGMSIER
jgi:5-methylcytosine-specific restriction endonuclease McrBC regulatory subunit McrC